MSEPSVEEGGEDIFTKMPTFCDGIMHRNRKSRPRLKLNDRGFLACPVCGCSYGRPTGYPYHHRENSDE